MIGETSAERDRIRAAVGDNPLFTQALEIEAIIDQKISELNKDGSDIEEVIGKVGRLMEERRNLEERELKPIIDGAKKKVKQLKKETPDIPKVIDNIHKEISAIVTRVTRLEQGIASLDKDEEKAINHAMDVVHELEIEVHKLKAIFGREAKGFLSRLPFLRSVPPEEEVTEEITPIRRRPTVLRHPEPEYETEEEIAAARERRERIER